MSLKAVERNLADWRKEQKERAERLGTAKPPSEDDVNKYVLSVLHQIYGLKNCLAVLALSEERTKFLRRDLHARGLRTFLKNVESITVHTTPEGHGTRTRHRLMGGEMKLRAIDSKTGKTPVGVVTGKSYPA